MADTQLSPQDKNWSKRFFTIWTPQSFSLLGSQLVQFALVWWLAQKTGSATVLATASLAGLLPQVFILPFAGALVDRWNRRKTMIAADGLIALATVLLAVLYKTGVVQIWHIYLLMFIRSTAGGFHWPAMTASTTLMVPKEHLSRIQGLNQMLQGGMNIAAAPLAALLLTFLPIEGVLVIDVGTAILAITPLLFTAVPQPEISISALDGAKPSLWVDLRAGLRYVMGWPGLVMIMLMATVINFLLTPASSLIPILVTRHFSGQAPHLAWMESAWGIGAVLGGLTLSIWGGFKRRIFTSMLGLLGLGFGSLLIGLLPASMFSAAVATMFLLGVFNPITNGPLHAAVQAAVAPEMQGRVFTLISSAASAMSPLGLILAGPLADRLGVQSWFLIGGVVTAVMGVSGFFIPALVHFEDGRTVENGVELERRVLAVSPVEIE